MSQPPYPPQGDPQPEWQPGPTHEGQDDVHRQETRPFPPSPVYGQQPGYGQPGYGQPPYGQPPFGQPPFGQPPYGQLPWAQPGVPGPQPPKNNRNTVIAIVAVAVLVVAGVGVALWFTIGRSNPAITALTSTTHTTTVSSAPTTASSSEGTSSSGGTTTGGGSASGAVPSPTLQPTGLGDDPVENQYAQECYDGDMASCDALFIIADNGTAYSTFADTCAGRQPEGTDRLCEDSFPG